MKKRLVLIRVERLVCNRTGAPSVARNPSPHKTSTPAI